MMESGARIKCYNFRVNEFNKSVIADFGVGNRIEAKTHNWLIFRNFINLSFSYMTFVIKENFDSGYIKNDFLFDLEGYDFIYDRESMFTSDHNLVTLNYEKLLYILQHYESQDPILLEMLHYVNKSGDMPLQISLRSKNHRMVNLILGFMSKINFAAVSHLKNEFDDLLLYAGFEEYLCECPFDSVQMVNKQTLKIQSAEDEVIVATSPSRCSYVDGDYFRDVMGERHTDTSFLTFPVIVKAVRADWLLDDNSDSGLDFLRDLMKVQDSRIFATDYVTIVIQFLYSRFRDKIVTQKLPFYIAHLASVLLGVVFNDLLRDKRKADVEALKLDPDFVAAVSYLTVVAPGFNVAALVITSLNLIEFGRQLNYLRIRMAYRFWTYTDLFSLGLNFSCSITSLGLDDPQSTRVVESLLILVMFVKLLYYLRLIPEIAPLVSMMAAIVVDIGWFMTVWIIFIFALTLSFYSVGKNQLDLGQDVPYSTYIGSFDHVYASSLGEFDTEAYYGDEMEPFCLILFLFLSFFMTITMLNMLIAIMGHSFARNAEAGESKKKISQLEFVVDNWYMDPIDDKDNIVYIISAKVNNGEDNTDERFDQLQASLERIKIQQDNEMTEIKGIVNRLIMMKSGKS